MTEDQRLIATGTIALSLPVLMLIVSFLNIDQSDKLGLIGVIGTFGPIIMIFVAPEEKK